MTRDALTCAPEPNARSAGSPDNPVACVAAHPLPVSQAVRDGWPPPGGYGLLQAGITWSEPVQALVAIKHTNHQRRGNFPPERRQPNVVVDVSSGKEIIRDARPTTTADTSFTDYQALTAGLHARGYFADTWMAAIWHVQPGTLDCCAAPSAPACLACDSGRVR